MSDVAKDDVKSAKSELGRYQFWRKVWLAVAGVGLFGLCAIVASHWEHYHGHSVIEGIGWLLIATGILGRLWCTMYIGERKAAMIVTSGPYSICRNPLYLFSAVAVAGIGAQTGTLTLAALFGLFTVVAFQIVIRREEKFLQGAFGQPYLDYCARTPRFWPNPSLHNSPEIVEVHPKRMAMTLADGLVFLLAIPVMELIEHLQFSGVIKPLLYLW